MTSIQTRRNSFGNLAAITTAPKKKKTIEWFPKRVQLAREFILLARRHRAAKQTQRDRGGFGRMFKSREGSSKATTEEQKLDSLLELFPTSKLEERERFLRAKHGNITNAAKKLEKYLNWREQHNLDSLQYNVESISDENDWNESYRFAMEYAVVSAVTKKNRLRSNLKLASKIPQISFVYNNECGDIEKTSNGNMVLHIMPGLIDLNLATPELYALTMALYLDRKFDREKHGYATVFLDFRAGKGWPNQPAFSMMPFIRMIAGFLHKYFPRRFDSCVMYNLPKSAMWIWEMVKPFLDRSALESIIPISGSDRHSGLAPNDKLSEFVDFSLLEKMEKKRLSFFVHEATSDC
mmetsp:Transcript_22312/g.32938  ORF Transcript_22312/g.32938 Transcript_22312/m.32938 type:complete len:351 (-) Transcript_22312:130-1182(-)|eukprot:CAMPEP_0194200670 /NCGR_PEP_ID=MMETSP0156-20130528/1175_1 /TAXON_ID=33649 /ORGANISM="Thalassionema nitzschioides, Strain L26-B" /LENGTH=350 /DNA_ID=CAMNT_0038925699 /DNA_START=58 /DNA_END=1110 /DNA_ORIENTATION=+